MNELSGSHYFLRLFTSTANCAISFFSVPRRVYVGRIYSSIAKDLEFDWTIQVTPAVILSYFHRSRWFIFTK